MAVDKEVWMDEIEILRSAREAIKQGDKVAGRRLLGQAIGINPHSETAWLWLSAIVDDPGRERECLERVLQINPDNAVAQHHLERLVQAQASQPASPPHGDVPVEPISPKPAAGVTSAPRTKSRYSRSTKIMLGIVGLLVACVCIGLASLNMPTGGQKATTTAPRATATPTARPNPASYSTIDIRELESYANRHVGRRVRLTGTVFNIGDGFLQMWVNKPNSEWDRVAVIVSYPANVLPSGVYEDSEITVYGVVMGTQQGENAFGAQISQPHLRAEIIR
jgi:hypothetical protein